MSGLFSFEAELLQSHSHDLLEKHLVAKTVEYIRRHSIIFALTELHVTKFYFLSHSLMCSVNSNNILAATSTLRDIFELVGTYAHFYQSAQKKGSQNSLIENAKDILTTTSANSRDSKLAINAALSEYTEHDSSLGGPIYSYLCAFVHPNFLSNDIFLRFFDDENNDIKFDDVHLKASGFIIGPRNEINIDFSPVTILLLTYQILTITCTDTIKHVYDESSNSLRLRIMKQLASSGNMKNKGEIYNALTELSSLIIPTGDKYEDGDFPFSSVERSEEAKVIALSTDILSRYHEIVYDDFEKLKLNEDAFKEDEKKSDYKSLNNAIKKYKNYEKSH